MLRSGLPLFAILHGSLCCPYISNQLRLTICELLDMLPHFSVIFQRYSFRLFDQFRQIVPEFQARSLQISRFLFDLKKSSTFGNMIFMASPLFSASSLGVNFFKSSCLISQNFGFPSRYSFSFFRYSLLSFLAYSFPFKSTALAAYKN